MAKFSFDKWFAERCTNQVVPVKIVDNAAGLDDKGRPKYAKIKLQGYVAPGDREEMLVELARSQKEPVEVNRPECQLLGVKFGGSGFAKGDVIAELLEEVMLGELYPTGPEGDEMEIEEEVEVNGMENRMNDTLPEVPSAPK